MAPALPAPALPPVLVLDVLPDVPPGTLPESLLDAGGVAVTVVGGGLTDWPVPPGATTVTAA